MPFRRARRATTYDAIAYLASACDGALRRDNHGFSTDHVQVGHRLARAKRWSRRDRRQAKRLIRYYRRQLTTAGYDVNGLLGRGGRERWVHTVRRRRQVRWSADPTGVHKRRFWNGHRWTEQVADV